MTLRTAFVLSLLAGSLAAGALGCTDAGLCTRGAPGCAPTKQGVCDNGLEPEDGLCTEDEGNDGGGGSGGGPIGDARPTWREPGPPPSIACSGDTVADLCGEFCDALCQNQERFCNESQCTAAFCNDNGDLYRPCIDSCAPNGEEDADALDCARSLCEAQVDETLSCETFGYLDRAEDTYETLCLRGDPLCVQNPELGCSRTCGTDEGGGEQLLDNNTCNDGHPEDGEGPTRCPRGSDCGDCPKHPCTPPGEECESHGDCCGFFAVGALCATSGSDDTPLCRAGCNDDNPCPDGFTCIDTPLMSVCIEN